MNFLLISAFFAFFICLAWINFRFAICMLFLILPAYLIRFDFGPLPSTLLELSFGAVALIWAIKYLRSDWEAIAGFFRERRVLTYFIIIFLLSALIAAFSNPIPLKALGIWRAYFLEPIVLFFILIGRSKEIRAGDLIKFLALSTVSISLLAILQKITGIFYPPELWDDQLSGRPTSFFTTPNAIGLFVAPIIPLAAWLTYSEKKPNKYLLIILLALLAVFFSFSQGAWIALGAGAILFTFLLGRKKTAIAVILAGIIVAFAIPQLRSAVLFRDQAGENRLTLWRYSTSYLIQSPKNFILGAGLRRFFTEVQKPHYNVEEMERLIYPHNIFLNFWLETGLLGMASFAGLCVCLIYFGFATLKENRLLGAGIISALAVLIIHGLVDVPYFKNDLSMLFWIVAALTSVAYREKNQA